MSTDNGREKSGNSLMELASDAGESSGVLFFRRHTSNL